MNINELIKEHGGIMLDIGCGPKKQLNFVGMDKEPWPGVDIVHDIETIPWPLPDESVSRAVMSHIFEHINPAGGKVLEVMNELWRVMKLGGEVFIEMPYSYGFHYVQDPTHCNPANEATWQYFDPRFPLWTVYRPRTWVITDGFPTWQINGNMQVVMRKGLVRKKAKAEAKEKQE